MAYVNGEPVGQVRYCEYEIEILLFKRAKAKGYLLMITWYTKNHFFKTIIIRNIPKISYSLVSLSAHRQNKIIMLIGHRFKE